MFLTLTLALGLQAPFSFQSGLAINNVTRGGRMPAYTDSVVDGFVKTGVFDTSSWKKIEVDKDGGFDGVNSGYVSAEFDSPKDQTLILEANGHSMVYVNGAPRVGDVYGYGMVKIPVELHAGKNQFVFASGRGKIVAKLVQPRADQQLETADLTLPDEVDGETAALFGGIVVLNNTGSNARGLTIQAESEGKTMITTVPVVAPDTLRKVRFDFAHSQSESVNVSLWNGDKMLDRQEVKIRHRKPTENCKRTFVSEIDGSVQYYGVTPSLKPSSASNSLVLTLHGASVEGIGQAAAYTPKDWTWIVAPTNRRPYGFDWEDWGRMDAIEVLNIAEKTLPHDPKRVYLTGHSMGGHGTWSVGTMYPNRFASIAPSAGWVSFWSYAGGWQPKDPNPTEQVLRGAMNASDTMARVHNLQDLGVYILHGDADDNVPVEQARTMYAAMKDWHPDVQLHEQPGAGHWWGNECVDWPDIWKLFLRTERKENLAKFAFTTPDPAISSEYQWLQILQVTAQGDMAGFSVDGSTITTNNVAAIKVSKATDGLTIDGSLVGPAKLGDVFVKAGDRWAKGVVSFDDKNPARGGPYKMAYQNRMAFVYGTAGTAEENAWAFNKARYDSETWYYRGNGAVDLVSDTAADSLDTKRNLVLYGNSATNRMWKSVLDKSPMNITRDTISGGAQAFRGSNAALFLYPSGDRTIAVVGGTDVIGCRLTDRLPVFTSGVAYSDWTVFGTDTYSKGTKGVLSAGNFGNRWELR